MESVELKSLIRITNGFAFKSERYVDNDGARIIRITNVQKGKIVDNDPKKYSFEDLKNLESYRIFENDILMSLTGNVGRVGRFPSNLLPAYINQRVCRVKSISEKLHDKYLFHYLNSDIFENEAIQNSAGAAQLNLSTNWLLSHKIPLPDLATQQKIAALLDKAGELRQYNKQLIEKYDTLTQSLFLDMFGDPVRNEKGFPKTTVRNLCEEVKYGTSAKSDGSGKWPYLRMNNITYSGYMDFSDVKSINVSEKDFVKYSVKKGDVLFNRTNSKELVGKTGIITNDDTYIIAGYLIRVRVNQVLANPYFLWAHLNSKWAKLTLSNMCKNIVGMANINAQELQDILILQPPVTLQNQFAERVQVIEQQKELAQLALQKTEELFNSLLQKAFKGELVAEYEV